MTTTTIQSQVKHFIEQLENNGDIFFSTGDYKQDFAIIASVISTQGFWSGDSLRYYVDTNLNVTSTESRW